LPGCLKSSHGSASGTGVCVEKSLII